MPKLKVYISSTYLDKQVARDTIIKRIQEGLKDEYELTNIMEHMKGDPENRADIDICLAEVRKADLYIILTGNRYGSHPPTFTTKDGVQKNTDDKSYTEIEYDTACEVLKEKFYGIYKLELTDAYLTELAGQIKKDNGEDAKKYLEEDPENKTKLENFAAKLSKTVSPIKINTTSDLIITVNNKLTEFLSKYNTKIELAITPSDKASIDRTEVLQEVKELDINAGAYTLLMEIENDNDCYEEFTAKLQNELTKKYPEKNVGFINSGPFLTFADDSEKIINKLLKEASLNIYGDIKNGATFEALAQDLSTIRNVFIGFLVDSKTDILHDGFNFVNVIATFVKKIDAILKEKNFGFNFYFVIYTLSPKNEIFPANLFNCFNGLNFFHIGRLPDVKKDDAMLWLDGIRKRNTSIEDDTSTLFRMVFLSDDKFPSKYKQCIELIDKRTK